ncbi:hypothetical protein [Flavobacterium nitrogenifigens]|uniref:hypothetical protein n=1 Tax=Flavobacterium nitrogenifigens TaxID=1617283 RepID=UPI000DAD7580|nr:hypothetical protein [Flavobacterium nitrogenifigens]KAF2335286.1 hypothetical protein DM397_07435 [Flavobacterium nitrogenifigens]
MTNCSIERLSRLIRIGELKLVKKTPFDFALKHKISERIEKQDEQLKFEKGYDCDYGLNTNKEDGFVHTVAIKENY